MAGFAAVFAVLTAAAIVGSASARFVVEKSAVKVIRPEHIRGRHDAALANFGVPNYGGTMIGVVRYQEANSTACDAFDGEPFKTGANRRPVILLVDRGGERPLFFFLFLLLAPDCYFALKAWNAQQAGAAAVLVADNVDEPLLTMDNPEESQDTEYVDKISIPAALINREFGATLKKAVATRDELVIIKLDWRESMPHPDERVEYEFWTNSNDECGPRCDDQMSFVKNFKGHAQLLERGGFTQFTPRYITWFCPDAFLLSKQCKAQCINKGRYCAPDPEQDFSEGYDGKDVVIENLRQLCVHRVGNETGRPWVWWDFVTDFHVRCSMKNKTYSRDCAEEVVESLGKFIDLIISSNILKEKHFLMRLPLMYQVCPWTRLTIAWVIQKQMLKMMYYMPELFMISTGFVLFQIWRQMSALVQMVDAGRIQSQISQLNHSFTVSELPQLTKRSEGQPAQSAPCPNPQLLGGRRPAAGLPTPLIATAVCPNSRSHD